MPPLRGYCAFLLCFIIKGSTALSEAAGNTPGAIGLLTDHLPDVRPTTYGKHYCSRRPRS